MNEELHFPISAPAAPPSRASMMLSVSNWRIKRTRLAPMAARTASSLRRVVARTSRILATLTQATSRTRITSPMKMEATSGICRGGFRFRTAQRFRIEVELHAFIRIGILHGELLRDNLKGCKPLLQADAGLQAGERMQRMAIPLVQKYLWFRDRWWPWRPARYPSKSANE